jgi:predicted DNA-binding protein
MPEQSQLSIRLPSEYVEKLEVLANEEDRSITAEVRRLIRLHLTERGLVAA